MKLSIIIPTRNRQIYCTQAVKWILANKSNEFEVVVSDNSDDVDLLIELLTKYELIDDPRLVLLISKDLRSTLSMRQNWNRGYLAANGEWIAFIGDDDYLDPNVTFLIDRIQSTTPAVDFIRWVRVIWDWPDNRKQDTVVGFPLTNATIKKTQGPKRIEYLKNFCNGEAWIDGLSPYHAVTKRSLLEEVRSSNQNLELFEHHNVDYWLGWQMEFRAKMPILVNRPLSVLGASAKSNSAAIRRSDIARQRWSEYLADSSGDNALGFESLSELADDVVKTGGSSLSIGLRQPLLDFLEKNKLKLSDGAEHNFVKLCEKDVEQHFEETSFLTAKQAHEIFLSKINHPFKHLFNPTFKQRSVRLFTGLKNETMYVRHNFGGCQSVGQFYYLINQLMVPIPRIGIA
jgi:glycosyltransferase involved in cell wall biosynthesis